jgi:hypothetical protein
MRNPRAPAEGYGRSKNVLCSGPTLSDILEKDVLAAEKARTIILTGALSANVDEGKYR